MANQRVVLLLAACLAMGQHSIMASLLTNMRNWLNLGTFLVSSATLVVVFFYTKAVFQQNEIAQRSLEVNTRPWVGFVDAGVSGKPLHFEFKTQPDIGRSQYPKEVMILHYDTLELRVKNYGNSPALHYTYGVGLYVERNNQDVDKLCSFHEKEAIFFRNEPYVTIFPQSQLSDKVPEHEPGAGLRLPAGLSSLKYVWIEACAVYFDQFPDSKVHHSKAWFRSVIRSPGTPVRVDPGHSLTWVPFQKFELVSSWAD